MRQHHVEREGLARPGSELSGLPGLPQPRRQRPHVISREGGAFSQGAAPAPPENGPHAREERLRANKEKKTGFSLLVVLANYSSFLSC